MHRNVPSLALALLLAACSNPGRKASMDVAPEEDTFQVPTEIVVEPAVWETAGSSIEPTMRLAEGPATRALTVTFEYTGDGQVQLPKRGHVEVGSDQVVIDGMFSASAPRREGRGAVLMTITDAETDQVISTGEWPVLQRASIICDIQTLRARPLVEGDYFACYVAVRYDPMDGGAAVPADRDDRVELVASIEKQGGFQPQATVVRELDSSTFQGLPAGFEEDDAQRVFFVSVEEPAFPPIRRAYLTLEARVSGDTHTSYVPLPNR